MLSYGIEEASGRPVQNWPYDKLAESSDLIAIATPIASEDTKDDFGTHPWPLEVVGINTEFTILHIVKGEVREKNIKVLHFRFGKLIDSEEKAIYNGPSFVKFTTIPKEAARQPPSQARPEYLLFVRKLKDGRYEFVSGKYDPALSIREMRLPLTTIRQTDTGKE
jgi:hypothetical protein